MRKHLVIFSIVLILALIPIVALAKPEPNSKTELTSVHQYLDPELHPGGTLPVRIDGVSFQEPVSDLYAMIQLDTWEPVNVSNTGDVKLAIHLADSYEIYFYEEYAAVFDGYASLHQASKACYKVPDSVHSAVDAYLLSHAQEVANAKHNPNLEPGVIQVKLSEGSSFRVNSFGNISGEQLLTALAPDTWTPMEQSSKPQGEHTKLVIYMGDNDFYYITVYETYLSVRDDLRIPLYKNTLAYYTIPVQTQESIDQLLETLSK